MVVEPRPPGPVAADGEAAEDEEDEDVLDLVGPRAHHETGLADQETQPDTDVNIPASSHRHELCPPSLPLTSVPSDCTRWCGTARRCGRSPRGWTERSRYRPE